MRSSLGSLHPLYKEILLEQIDKVEETMTFVQRGKTIDLTWNYVTIHRCPQTGTNQDVL